MPILIRVGRFISIFLEVPHIMTEKYAAERKQLKIQFMKLVQFNSASL